MFNRFKKQSITQEEATQVAGGARVNRTSGTVLQKGVRFQVWGSANTASNTNRRRPRQTDSSDYPGLEVPDAS